MSDPAVIPGCGVLPPAKPREPRKGAPRTPAPSGKAAGRFQALNAFVDATLRDLTGTQVKVWLILYRDTKPNGLARASDADLARRAGVWPRSVGRARRRLAALGLLEVVRRGGLRSGPSVYRVRSLAEDPGVLLSADKRRTVLRTPVSYIPEGSQNKRLDPYGSDAPKKKRAPAAGGPAA